jgi:hypothetical protein
MKLIIAELVFVKNSYIDFHEHLADSLVADSMSQMNRLMEVVFTKGLSLLRQKRLVTL